LKEGLNMFLVLSLSMKIEINHFSKILFNLVP